MLFNETRVFPLVSLLLIVLVSLCFGQLLAVGPLFRETRVWADDGWVRWLCQLERAVGSANDSQPSRLPVLKAALVHHCSVVSCYVAPFAFATNSFFVCVLLLGAARTSELHLRRLLSFSRPVCSNAASAAAMALPPDASICL